MLNEQRKVDIHLIAMRNILAANGGLGALGFNGFLACVTRGFAVRPVSELRLADLSRYITMIETLRTAIATENDLAPNTIPSHPFSPKLCRRLTKLPEGFSEVCLTRTLTYRCIGLLERITTSTAQIFTAQLSRGVLRFNNLTIVMCVRMLGGPPCSTNEILAIIGSLAFCIFRGGDLNLWYPVNSAVQVSCKQLMSVPFSDNDPGLMMWTAAMLRAVYGIENCTCDFADRLANLVRRCHPGLRPTTKDFHRFFWDQRLTVRLSETNRTNMMTVEGERSGFGRVLIKSEFREVPSGVFHFAPPAMEEIL